jgi:hypothetical protein
MPPTSFSAPWSQSLWIATAIPLLLLIGLAVACYFGVRLSGRRKYFWGILIPIGVLIYGASGAILGYSVEGDKIVVKELLSSISIPIEHGTTAKKQPGAMDGAIRLMGVGGFFRYSGTYSCHAIGKCQVYMTDEDNPVVVSAGGTVYVLSPGEPDKFVSLVNNNSSSK